MGSEQTRVVDAHCRNKIRPVHTARDRGSGGGKACCSVLSPYAMQASTAERHGPVMLLASTPRGFPGRLSVSWLALHPIATGSHAAVQAQRASGRGQLIEQLRGGTSKGSLAVHGATSVHAGCGHARVGVHICIWLLPRIGVRLLKTPAHGDAGFSCRGADPDCLGCQCCSPSGATNKTSSHSSRRVRDGQQLVQEAARA